jgi:hypothetical protein
MVIAWPSATRSPPQAQVFSGPREYSSGALIPPAAAKPRMSLRARYVLSVVIVIAVAVYLAATSAAHVFPFSSPVTTNLGLNPRLTENLTQLLPGNLSPNECRRTSAPDAWKAPGPVQVLHCTDPNLKGGNVYAYQLDNRRAQSRPGRT